MRWNRVLDGTWNGRNGGQVKYNVGTLNRGQHGPSIANVGRVPLNLPADFREVQFAAGKKIVDNPHLAVAASKQRAHKRRSKESGAAGDDVARHALVPTATSVKPVHGSTPSK